MKITVICVGKIKESFLKDGIKEYSKRISKYSALEITELNDEKAPENLSENMKEKIKEKEGEGILKNLKDGYTITLCIDGKNLSSEELSSFIETKKVQGINNFNFIIGGSLGLSNEVIKKADYKLSFSKMTFPHQLMRLILLEQIYRCFKISNNEPYHK